jgi:hypothetical protein
MITLISPFFSQFSQSIPWAHSRPPWAHSRPSQATPWAHSRAWCTCRGRTHADSPLARAAPPAAARCLRDYAAELRVVRYDASVDVWVRIHLRSIHSLYCYLLFILKDCNIRQIQIYILRVSAVMQWFMLRAWGCQHIPLIEMSDKHDNFMI